MFTPECPAYGEDWLLVSEYIQPQVQLIASVPELLPRRVAFMPIPEVVRLDRHAFKQTRYAFEDARGCSRRQYVMMGNAAVCEMTVAADACELLHTQLLSDNSLTKHVPCASDVGADEERVQPQQCV